VCLLPVSCASVGARVTDDHELYIAVMQWIAASLAQLSHFDICLLNNTQLKQV